MNSLELPLFQENHSHVRIVCKIRKPKQAEIYYQGQQRHESRNNHSVKRETSYSSVKSRGTPLKSPSTSYRQFARHRSTSSSKKTTPRSSLPQHFEHAVFTTVEESPYVIATDTQDVQSRHLQTYLVSQGDIAPFTKTHVTEGKAHLFAFDRVVSE